MKGAKQILLAGFAALCMVLPACRSTTHIENVEPPALVVSSSPLNSASYTAEYTGDGSLPFTCEVKLEDGKSTPAKDVDTAKARFFAGLVLDLDSVVSSARKKNDLQDVDGIPCYVYILELSGIPDMESCLMASALDTDRWVHLLVPMTGDSDTVFSTDFQEYKTESGVTYPSRIVSSTEGGAPVTCTIRDVKINPELPDELFRLSEPNG